ncbi:MAG TPA: MarR family transcriptional regulator [Mycobacteriales bacterium]|nr:MarR family transcriptional regulator [Mycobacteriales bacterium]
MRQITAADEALITTFGRLVEANSRLSRQLGRSLEQQAALPHAWFEVLLRVSRAPRGRISKSSLAEQVALTSGGITKMLDRMIDAGLVQREPCPTDRRVCFAALTPDGDRALTAAAKVHARNLRDVFAGFSEADLRALDDLLDRLRAAEFDDGFHSPRSS